MKKIPIIAIALFVGGALFAADTKIAPKDAKKLLDSKTPPVLLDVRTAEEFADGRIAHALLLPYDEITESTAAKAIPSKNTPVIVYCRSGRRSAIAVETLSKLGYLSVRDLGGIASWPYEMVRDK